MKIVSWNVNGLRACIKKGFCDTVKALDADIYCIQEVKAFRKQVKTTFAGYDIYWNSSRRRGYSGVLVLSRVAPLSVRMGFGIEKFDIEGRLLTLEFHDFYLLNVYQPLSTGRLSRDNYRGEWDDAFYLYLKSLSKPIVLCGDFNVAHTYDDIYPENLRNIKEPSGFQPNERANFDRLLHMGLADIYRLQNPDAHTYTWWSYRLFKRDENRGWRLDYFLVSKKLLSQVVTTDILSNTHGSDHCPIALTIHTTEIKEQAWQSVMLGKLWDRIDWKAYEAILLEAQQQLALLAQKRSYAQINRLQYEILNMPEAKALAVRHVAKTESETGMDGVKWETSTQKMQAAFDLEIEGYVCKPLRSVVIQDAHKERRINIPTYYDRAMQTLVRYALEPVAETWADRKSFGFRKGRSAFDVDYYICRTLKRNASQPLWILRCDVKSYYDRISHHWILEHLPLKSMLRAYLKAGILLNGELFPAMGEGISQGSGLSPVIGNMVLDGLQSDVYRHLYRGRVIENYAYGDVIRFADDFLVFANSQEQAIAIKAIVCKFLRVRGLTLSEEKTHIVSATEGFTFLGHRYYVRDGDVVSEPAEDGVRRFEQRLDRTIRNHNSSVEALIKKLNRMIVGFSSYHRTTQAGTVFRHLDVVIQTLLIEKVRQMFPRQPWEKLRKRYWYSIGNGQYVFTDEDKRHLRVIRFVDIILIEHIPVKTNYNYFLDSQYCSNLEKRRVIHGKSGAYKSIWHRQAGRCYLCGKPMLKDHGIDIVKYLPKQTVYIHSKCAENTTEYREITEDYDGLDVMAILESLQPMKESQPSILPTYDYGDLAEFFRKEQRQNFMVTFQTIGKLWGRQLGFVESTYTNFWYDDAPDCISHSWTKNGYTIRKLDLEQEQIYFIKSDHKLTAFAVPAMFWDKKIPKNAQDEVEAFLKYIAGKYGL